MFTTIEAMRIVHALCVIERDKQQDAQSLDLRRAISRTSAVLIERSRLERLEQQTCAARVPT